MKPRCKFRVATKWIGASVTVALFLVWVGSVWFDFGVANRVPDRSVFLGGGQLHIHWKDDRLAPKLTESTTLFDRRDPASFMWWYTDSWFPSGDWSTLLIHIPIWFLALVAGVPTWFLWHRDRRRRKAAARGRCPKCDYDLTGLPQGRACPECGT